MEKMHFRVIMLHESTVGHTVSEATQKIKMAWSPLTNAPCADDTRSSAFVTWTSKTRTVLDDHPSVMMHV